MITTLTAILITWYATKIYYTRTLHVKIDGLEKHGLTQAKCSKCSQNIVLKGEHLRTPFYCVACK